MLERAGHKHAESKGRSLLFKRSPNKDIALHQLIDRQANPQTTAKQPVLPENEYQD